MKYIPFFKPANKFLALLTIIFFVSFFNLKAQELTLEQTISLFFKNSSEAKSLNSDYELLKYNRADYSNELLPKISLSLNVPNFNRSFFEVTQPDGSLAFREQNSASSSLNLNLTQSLWFRDKLLNDIKDEAVALIAVELAEKKFKEKRKDDSTVL